MAVSCTVLKGKKSPAKQNKAGPHPSLLQVFKALTALRVEASEQLLLAHINHFQPKCPENVRAPLAGSYSVHELVMGVPKGRSRAVDQQP